MNNKMHTLHTMALIFLSKTVFQFLQLQFLQAESCHRLTAPPSGIHM
jgi:hypothetical protein